MLTGLPLVGHAGHSGAAGGSAAAFSLLLLLALGGVAVTYVTDTPASAPISVGISRFIAVVSSAAAALGATVAAGFHLAAAVVHALFFTVVAMGLLGLAAALVARSSPRVWRAGYVASAWLLVQWVLSHSLGIAFVTGREPVGLLDGTTAALELIVLLCCRVTLRLVRDPVTVANRAILGGRGGS